MKLKADNGRSRIDVTANDDELIVADLFCGGGGTSEALKQACEEMGLKYRLYAVNHWRTAIDTHEENHPEAKHACASVGAVDPLKFVPQGRLDLLMASPECIFYSSARGGKPVNDQRRSTAWDVVDVWMPALRPRQVLIENVPEFQNWGPLYPANHRIAKLRNRPNPKFKGKIFREYVGKMEAMGYTVEYRVQCAADFGAATTRKRLFIMASLGKGAITWPEPTHSKAGGNGLKKWRAAREIIDWNLKGESIFNRKRPLADKTMNRILVGLERHGGDALKPYLVALRNHMDGKSIDGPVPTVAAGGNHIGLAEPFVFHTTHSGRFTEVDRPLPTVTAAKRGEMGVLETNLVDAFMLSQQSGGAARSIDEPAMTVAAKGAIQLVEFVVPPRHMNAGHVDSVEDPLRTVTAAAGHCFGVVDACLVPFYNERDGQAPRSHSVEDPSPTIPATGDGKFGLAEGVLVEYHSETSVGENRTRTLDDPLPTQTTENRFGVATPLLLNLSHGQRMHDIDGPVPTITTAKGGELAVAEPVITSYYGTTNVSSVKTPLPTVTAKSRFGMAMPVINGKTLDIRFRMLQPHELAGAMDFPKGYKFMGKRKRGGGVNKGDQVRMIGNAVDVKHGKELIKTRIHALLAQRNQENAA
jgi:DNA (cytosine-5)-methyltransferase 1